MEQNLKLLFEAVRKQDVVLWIGAGFSLYAGYKSGKEFANKIYNKIDIPDRDGINKDDLQKVTLSFIDFNPEDGRKDLINFLKNEYINKRAKSRKYHDMLTEIIQIKTIITTNYDRLLELSYKDDGQLVYNDNHVRDIDENKVQIIKIHGDLKEPDNIILTREDYEKFFSSTKERNIWSLVKERVATKSQIFLGYSLDDSNVDYILNNVWNNIDKKKQSYLIAPDLTNAQKVRLERRDIIYIDSKGEKFISALCKDVKKNFVNDYNDKKIGTDSLQRALNKNNLSADFGQHEGKSIVKAIYTLNNSVKGKAHLTYDSSFKKIVNDALAGKIFDDVHIPLTRASIDLNGISVLELKGMENLHLALIRNPNIQSQIDIKFTDVGIEGVKGVPIRAYTLEYSLKVILSLKLGNIIINSEDQGLKTTNFDVEFNLETREKFETIIDVLEYYNLILNLFSGREFEISFPDGSKYGLKMTFTQTMVDNATFHINYFNSLMKIENYFNIRFDSFEFNSINKDSWDIVTSLALIANKEPLEMTMDDEFTIPYNELREDEKLAFLDIVHENKDTDFTFTLDGPEEISLHGKVIKLKSQEVCFKAMYISNLDEFNNGCGLLKFKSRTQRKVITYSTETREQIIAKTKAIETNGQ